MIDRNNILMVGLGGGGSSLVDTIVNQNPLLQPYFINTSITDIETLDNANKEIRNYLLISTTNGVGRNRKLGMACAESYGYNIIDIIERYQQDNVYLVSSFGGGSGSAILSVLLRAISDMKSEGEFEKKIHLIGILPSIKSADILLKNCMDTWNEMLEYSQYLDSMIFIDNDSKVGVHLSQREQELEINESFAEMFDSIFDIPLINGTNFDSANLGNILSDKGTLYFYELDEDCSSIEVCLQKAKTESVLAPMFKTEINTVFERDGSAKTKCTHLGFSFMEGFKFTIDNILKLFTPKSECYIGENEDKNILVVSGMLPPYDKINMINHELETRKTENDNDIFDFSKFRIATSTQDQDVKNEKTTFTEESTTKKVKKQKLKKNLFKKKK